MKVGKSAVLSSNTLIHYPIFLCSMATNSQSIQFRADGCSYLLNINFTVNKQIKSLKVHSRKRVGVRKLVPKYHLSHLLIPS